jgi:HlyD family secretion protein
VEEVSAAVGESVQSGEVLSTLELSSLPQAVILAYLDLEEAQNALDLEVAEAAKALADAQDALEAAQREQYNLTHPGKDVDIDQAFASMILAEDRLDKARDDYEPYANKPETNLERANFLLRLTEAQQAYDSAVRTYNAYSGTSSATNISVADADLALAEGQLAIAQRDYDNAVNAGDPNFTSSAEARVAAAEAAISQAHIEAPFTGMVTDADATPGDLVAPGDFAFRLDDLSRMLVDVEVSEVDINRVQVGQPATLTFGAAPEMEYHGEVTAVSLAGDTSDGAVNFRISVELTDADEFVRPGMTAAVNILVTQLDDVLLVPNRAVRIVDGQRVVYLLVDGQMQAVAVQLGATSEVASEVIGGDLQAGDTVVLNPPSNPFDPSQGPPAFIQQGNGGG